MTSHTANFDSIPIRAGIHEPESGEYCAMELVAKMAQEPHSDHPKTVSPIIGIFIRTWNDGLRSDEERAEVLRPILPRVLNTSGDEGTELQRSYMAFDWLVRVCLPAWLDMTPSLRSHAAVLSALSEITCSGRVSAAAPEINAARAAALDAALDAARVATRAAAWAAALDAAWDAAWAAALDAAWDAARVAARVAALDAARAAAREAARVAAAGAAWDAARAALCPTSLRIQASAQDLLVRMIEVQ